MIAAWMMYCTVIGMLVVLAAQLSESLVLARGGSTRRVWMIALLVAVALPVAAMVAQDELVTLPDPGAASVSAVGTIVMIESVDLLSSMDALLVRGWIVASVVLSAVLLLALVSVARRRRSWPAQEVDGVPVLVSDDVGPAVVGVLRTSIVLPRWALAENAVQRSLLLRHEQEHVAAGDPRLLMVAALLVVAMPWNLALWRLFAGLRTALEVDCDRRVIGRDDVDARSYGFLLLNVGRRRSPRAAMASIPFARSRSLLEMRIDRMTRSGRCGMARLAAGAVVVVAILAAAWSLPQPVRAAEVSNSYASCPASKKPAPSPAATRQP